MMPQKSTSSDPTSSFIAFENRSLTLNDSPYGHFGLGNCCRMHGSENSKPRTLPPSLGTLNGTFSPAMSIVHLLPGVMSLIVLRKLNVIMLLSAVPKNFSL